MPDPAAAVFEFLDATHRDIDQHLQVLETLAAAVTAGGLSAEDRRQAQGVLAFFRNEARQHHLDEEKHVFPPLIHSQNTPVADLAQRLLQDHGWLEQAWLEIDPSLEAATLGNQWFDPDEFSHAIQVFLALYRDHMTLEESLAYPEARQRILAQHTPGIGREMAKRRAARRAQAEH
jgi:hemerythrin-like domain-containing protein